MLAGLDQWPAEHRNTSRYIFLHPTARTLYHDWPQAAADAAAQLRTAVAADPRHPGLARLVAELTQASPEFTDLWQRHDVRQHRTDRKSFHHSAVGDITLTYESLYLEPDGQRLAIYQATPGTRDHEAMKLLALDTDLKTPNVS